MSWSLLGRSFAKEARLSLVKRRCARRVKLHRKLCGTAPDPRHRWCEHQHSLSVFVARTCCLGKYKMCRICNMLQTTLSIKQAQF